jgi:hypothetical protein
MPVMKILKKNLADEVTWQYEGVELHRDENSITVEAFFNRDDMPFQDIVLKRNDRFVETFIPTSGTTSSKFMTAMMVR